MESPEQIINFSNLLPLDDRVSFFCFFCLPQLISLTLIMITVIGLMRSEHEDLLLDILWVFYCCLVMQD